ETLFEDARQLRDELLADGALIEGKQLLQFGLGEARSVNGGDDIDDLARPLFERGADRLDRLDQFALEIGILLHEDVERLLKDRRNHTVEGARRAGSVHDV